MDHQESTGFSTAQKFYGTTIISASLRLILPFYPFPVSVCIQRFIPLLPVEIFGQWALEKSKQSLLILCTFLSISWVRVIGLGIVTFCGVKVTRSGINQTRLGNRPIARYLLIPFPDNRREKKTKQINMKNKKTNILSASGIIITILGYYTARMTKACGR